MRKEGAKSSSPGEFPPQALTDTDVTVSRHPALIIPSQLSETYFTVWLLPSLVGRRVKLDDPTPSLHPHYRDFIAITGYSVPVPRLGTLNLVGPPLGFLSYHRNDRFPRSTHEPDSGSRYLYAGRHPGSMQVSPGLILVSRKLPVLTSSNFISTPHQWFACARLPEPHLT